MSTAHERLEAAKKMTTEQLLALQCPSPEFEVDLKAINDRAGRFQAEADRLRRRLQLVNENRDIMEISGKDPDAEARAIRKPLTDAEAGASRTPSDLYDLFVAECAIFQLKRNAAWLIVYEQFVSTFESDLVQRFNQLKTSLEAVCQEMVGALDTSVSSTGKFTPMFITLDKSALALNGFLSKTKLSPQQFAVQNPLRESVSQVLRQSFAKLPMNEINKALALIGVEQLKTRAQWLLDEAQRPTNMKWLVEHGEAETIKRIPQPIPAE